MERRQPKGRLRAFFKVYLPCSAVRISMPRAYVTYMEGKIPQSASLRDRDGKVWPVKAEQIGDDLFFTDGWNRYVEDNSLELGDFLVFQYDGRRLYDVKLLGKNGSEKNIAAEAIDQVDQEEVEETYEGVNESVEEEEEIEKVEKTTIALRVAVGDANSSGKYSKGEKPVEADKDKHRRIKLGPYGDQIFKSGLISRPKNPYFVTSVRRKRRNELYVPVDFIQDHNLSLPSEIKIQDQQGRKWISNLRPWKDGRVWYYGGWARLCRTNMVEENDVCICELQKGISDGVEFFQVNVVPQDIMLKINN